LDFLGRPCRIASQPVRKGAYWLVSRSDWLAFGQTIPYRSGYFDGWHGLDPLGQMSFPIPGTVQQMEPFLVLSQTGVVCFSENGEKRDYVVPTPTVWAEVQEIAGVSQ
jgi:hypothetical protein